MACTRRAIAGQVVVFVSALVLRWGFPWCLRDVLFLVIKFFVGVKRTQF